MEYWVHTCVGFVHCGILSAHMCRMCMCVGCDVGFIVFKVPLFSHVHWLGRWGDVPPRQMCKRVASLRNCPVAQSFQIKNWGQGMEGWIPVGASQRLGFPLCWLTQGALESASPQPSPLRGCVNWCGWRFKNSPGDTNGHQPREPENCCPGRRREEANKHCLPPTCQRPQAGEAAAETVGQFWWQSLKGTR